MRHARARHYQRECSFWEIFGKILRAYMCYQRAENFSHTHAYVGTLSESRPIREIFLPTCRDDFGNCTGAAADR